MPDKFAIALIQINLDNRPEKNLVKCIDWIKKSAAKGAKVICLPELYSSFYFCQEENTKYFELAESLYENTYKAFSSLAGELGVVLIVPFFEKRAPGLYHNSSYTFNSDGEMVSLYRKMHIPDDPSYYEKFYFAPGDLGFKVADTEFGKIGTMICWDQWYPEGSRITSLLGADVLFYPTAIGWHPHEKEQYGAKQHDAWITVQRGHAVANGIYVAAVNRVGFEQPIKDKPGIEFWGSSFIAGPQGEIIVQASSDKEEIIMADVDRDLMADVRQNWPFLRDRRVDAYEGILKRFID